MGHVLELFLSIFDFMHFMARQGFHTSITEVVAKLVFSKFNFAEQTNNC